MRGIRPLLTNRWVFAVLYVLLIPIFMGLYSWRAGDFFSATATQERAYRSAVAQLGPLLIKDLESDLTTVTTTTTPSLGPMAIARRDVSFHGIEVPDDEHVSINIDYACTSTTSESHVSRAHASLPLTVTTQPELKELQTGGPVRTGVPVQQQGVDTLCNADVGRLLGIQHLAGTDTVAFVGRSFLHLADAVGRAKDGYLDQLPGRYGRAAYLSAVVVTTLGFGDVVPVTGIARTLIGFEAVLGILFGGLFINAVSQKRRTVSPGPHTAPSSPGEGRTSGQ